METERTLFDAEETSGLGRIEILHPPGTFSITPASLISLQTIFCHQDLLGGVGIDWGPGTGCLSIAAARIGSVTRIIGLEISRANVDEARKNVLRNGLEGEVDILLSDSYTPVEARDAAKLDDLEGKVDFILSNPDASEGDDGFGYRREVPPRRPEVPGERWRCCSQRVFPVRAAKDTWALSGHLGTGHCHTQLS